MNIEIKNVSLAPNYLSHLGVEVCAALALMCTKSDEHLMMVTRAAMANRGDSVFCMLVDNSRRIDRDRAHRISEIVSCGQYNDERTCCKIKELLKTPRNRKDLMLI